MMNDFNSEALMGHLMNDRELAEEILGIYLDSSRELLDKLDAAIKAGDVEAAALYSHSLKGSSSNVGAERLTDLALRSEQAAKNGDLDRPTELLSQIKTAFGDFLQAVKQEGWSN